MTEVKWRDVKMPDLKPQIYHFDVLHFQFCKFTPRNLVRHFQIWHFHVLHFRPPPGCAKMQLVLQICLTGPRNLASSSNPYSPLSPPRFETEQALKFLEPCKQLCLCLGPLKICCSSASAHQRSLYRYIWGGWGPRKNGAKNLTNR